MTSWIYEYPNVMRSCVSVSLYRTSMFFVCAVHCCTANRPFSYYVPSLCCYVPSVRLHYLSLMPVFTCRQCYRCFVIDSASLSASCLHCFVNLDRLRHIMFTVTLTFILKLHNFPSVIATLN